MTNAPKFKFSHHFKGVIWNTMAVPNTNLLIVEARDDKNFQAQFSAVDFITGKILWDNLQFKENWWISLTAANAHSILFHTYINRGNPDHKNLIAYDIFEQKIRWEVEEFSFFDWNDSEIWGFRTVADPTPAVISVRTGELKEQSWKADSVMTQSVQKPVRYLEGMEHFETIKKFIESRTSHVIVKGAEYFEWKEWIMASVYVEMGSKLANYLIVFDQKGEKLAEEILGENLTGLGTDTFFMLSGCLILVKNKSELVVYGYD